MSITDRSDRVCIVGAGLSGLAAAKSLKEYGFAFDIIEREDDLGGNWNYGKPNARVYRSTHTVTSKKQTEFPDFPMPSSYPDYPHHTQILNYLRHYAKFFDVDRGIEYNTSVEGITPHDDGRRWDVKLSTGETRRYMAVVIGNGHNWCPKYPDYPGTFTGEVMHSAQYKTPDVLAGKRVVVVGAGNSGCDLAVEAAQNHATVYHSTRRGYYYIPKFLFGRPSDRLGDKMQKLYWPLWLRRWLTTQVLKWAVGSWEKYGLQKPDHKLYETHPINNTLLLYHIRHGDVIPKPDVARLDGRKVHFVDGTAVEVDTLVYATGYKIQFPFIDVKYLNWYNDRPNLYKNIFHPQYDNLFVAGLIQPDGGQFLLAHWQTQAIAAYLKAHLSGSPAAAAFQLQKQEQFAEDLRGGIRHLNTTRHYLQIEHWSYRQGLQKIVQDLTAVPKKAAA